MTKEERKVYNASHYQNNKEAYRGSRKSNRPAYVARNREFVETYKSSRPCTDCGNLFPSCAMDFDHLQPKDSKYNAIGHLVQKCASIERIVEEIAKCELVCANCHRVRTSNRLYGIVV